MDNVERFAAEIDSFAHWATHGEDDGALAARNALRHLITLYATASDLPLADPQLPGEELHATRVSQEDWDMVFKRGSRMPFDMYGEVFDPHMLPPEQPVVGSLADDIADIYRDLVSGLRLYRSDHKADALWEWRFSLYSHWGQHATGAIRALHAWLARNE